MIVDWLTHLVRAAFGGRPYGVRATWHEMVARVARLLVARVAVLIGIWLVIATLLIILIVASILWQQGPAR